MQIEKPAATNEKNLTTDVKSRIHKLKLCRSGRSATTAYCSNLKARETMDISQAEGLIPQFNPAGTSKAVPLSSLRVALRCRTRCDFLILTRSGCKIRFPRNTVVPQVNHWNQSALNLSGVARMAPRHRCG